MHNIPIVNWDHLPNWKPKPGDWIIYNNLFSQWYGIILKIEGNNLKIRYDGLMILLVQETKEKIKTINTNKIKNSKNGKYTIIRNNPNSTMPLWFLA
jgi:hypothetical protein